MRILTTIALVLLLAVPAEAIRVKDIARLAGDRDNAVTGYGLVIGLANTGDTEQALFTVQSVAAMLTRMGVRVDPKRLRTRNVAAVMVTAKLPSFAAPGTRVDVVVSSLGNARSLSGGTLLMTPLKAVDGNVYGIAQGPLSVGGYSAGASGSRVTKNHPTVGRVPGGAMIERGLPQKIVNDGKLVYLLDKSDFTTANNVAKAISSAGAKARALDGRRIEVEVPQNMSDKLVELVAKIETSSVQTDVVAKVVLNARTGTVVLGGKVQLGPVAVAHGNLHVEVQTNKSVSQPAALGAGTTTSTANSRVSTAEGKAALRLVSGGANLDELVTALNTLGASPRDLIDILQAMKSAGALAAEIEIQ
jgi:flagellar P-ring protein precursor FlgI